MEPVTVKDAIHKLQLCLLEGIHEESQLFAAGSLLSQSDYQDVVTERSIVGMCGYPLCTNSLPADRPRRGRYKISLKEHKVYDLQETYMYCSTNCVVNSQAFSGSLQQERCSDLDLAKSHGVLRLFEGLLDSEEGLGENGDLGLSKLTIQEKDGASGGDMSMEEWVGPANAVEGYVPQRDRGPKTKNRKEKGSKTSHSKPSQKGGDMIFNDMDFMSTIITQDEYSISKMPSHQTNTVSNAELMDFIEEVSHKEMKNQLSETPSTSAASVSANKFEESNGQNRTVAKDKFRITEVSSGPSHSDLKMNDMVAAKESKTGKAAHSSSSLLKPSLKSSDATKLNRSVTWADDRTDSADNRNLCEFSESEDSNERTKGLGNTDMKNGDNASRFASAEACAVALSQAAEAVESEESDVPAAVSEAGIIILPPPYDEGAVGSEENIDDIDPEPTPIKWPRKSGVSESDFFDSEDSWYDSPPEGFGLTLSPFATMFMSVFAWISSSSLAYIYGHDDSFHEEYLSINGKEYARKIVMTDGRSSEIKQTLAGCLSRALPGLVSGLRLPTPVSTLEQGLSCLLDTMSFVDPVPPLRIKQWQVLVLLLIDALSVCRIPALTPHMINGRRLFQKVFDSAQISAEEYEILKDLVIPNGRVPQLSTQCGG